MSGPIIQPSTQVLMSRYRLALGAFMAGLVVSGITAFPLLHELELLVHWTSQSPPGSLLRASGFPDWILIVRDGLRESYSRYPWIAYGTDWLAFAHLAIALFFIGPFKDPIGNSWVLYAGLAACAGVVPLALLCGQIRGIPMGWRLIDCSFGVIGAVPLLYCLSLTRKLRSASAGAKRDPVRGLI